MNQQQWDAVDGYVCERLIAPDAALEGALAASAAGGLPEIQVAANQGKLLMLLARMVGASRILEIGTLGGYSTIWLARGLALGGKLISLEVNPAFAEVARGNVAGAALGGVVEIRVGRASESLAAMEKAKEGPFDLVFIDADKASTPEYFAAALRLTRTGSVIVVDNVVREGAILEAESADPSVVGMRRFFEMVREEEGRGRVSGTAVQMVGVKGWDGMAVVVRNEE